jgi:hypothetical protein
MSLIDKAIRDPRDTGQRYVVSYKVVATGERCIFGWADTAASMIAMVQAIQNNPEWCEPQSQDRFPPMASLIAAAGKPDA